MTIAWPLDIDYVQTAIASIAFIYFIELISPETIEQENTLSISFFIMCSFSGIFKLIGTHRLNMAL